MHASAILYQESTPINQNCVILVTRNNLVLNSLLVSYDSKKFDKEERTLEQDIDRILVANGLQQFSDVNIQVMSGNLEDLEATHSSNIEFINALAQYIFQTGSTEENQVTLED